MRLSEWIERKGYGEIARIARELGVPWNTIHHIAREHRCASYALAKRISELLRGKAKRAPVSIDELCTAPASTPPSRLKRTPARRKRKPPPTAATIFSS